MHAVKNHTSYQAKIIALIRSENIEIRALIQVPVATAVLRILLVVTIKVTAATSLANQRSRLMVKSEVTKII